MTAPECLNCGSTIRKKTEKKSWWITDWQKAPKTIEEAKALSNYPMISHRWADAPKSDGGGRFIISASYWDGVSYEDPYFCNGKCAKEFGYACARSMKTRPRNDK